MSIPITFDEALQLTQDEDRTLLIGNGFSAKYFSYRNLLEKSGLSAGTPIRKLFSDLDTVDFEAVVRALDGATLVERAYGNKAQADQFEADAQKVREALVTAVNSTHPMHREDLASTYPHSAAFLNNFSNVFTLNYDLLLYWSNLENRNLSDGFGLGKQNGVLLGPFKENAYCRIYNLHGGLHLFEDGADKIMKVLDQGKGVVSTITDVIIKNRKMPIYVAEGTSIQKMRKINSINYLHHCYQTLSKNSAIIFVYGHSADETDAHIYRAIFNSQTKHVYFGIYKPDIEKIRSFDGALAKYQRNAGSSANYTFFDSESAKVWG